MTSEDIKHQLIIINFGDVKMKPQKRASVQHVNEFVKQVLVILS